MASILKAFVGEYQWGAIRDDLDTARVAAHNSAPTDIYFIIKDQADASLL